MSVSYEQPLDAVVKAVEDITYRPETLLSDEVYGDGSVGNPM
jgi:hypothetical protein